MRLNSQEREGPWGRNVAMVLSSSLWWVLGWDGWRWSGIHWDWSFLIHWVWANRVHMFYACVLCRPNRVAAIPWSTMTPTLRPPKGSCLLCHWHACAGPCTMGTLFHVLKELVTYATEGHLIYTCWYLFLGPAIMCWTLSSGCPLYLMRIPSYTKAMLWRCCPYPHSGSDTVYSHPSLH